MWKRGKNTHTHNSKEHSWQITTRNWINWSSTIASNTSQIQVITAGTNWSEIKIQNSVKRNKASSKHEKPFCTGSTNTSRAKKNQIWFILYIKYNITLGFTQFVQSSGAFVSWGHGLHGQQQFILSQIKIGLDPRACQHQSGSITMLHVIITAVALDY